MEILANLNVESREEEEMETPASLNVKIREEEVMETLGPNPSTPPNHQHSRVAQATGFSYEFQSTSDVDLPPLNNSKTQLSDDNCVTSNLHHDNRNVRKLRFEHRALAPGDSNEIKGTVVRKNTKIRGIMKKIRKSQVQVVDPKICVPPEIKLPCRFQGHVPPGTQQLLLHLLSVYSTELTIGCHGILTAMLERYTVFLGELNHGNIDKLYGFILRDNTPEILMEYAVFLRKIMTEVPWQWAQDSSNAGPIRYYSRNRRRRKDRSSLPYGYTDQKMDTGD